MCRSIVFEKHLICLQVLTNPPRVVFERRLPFNVSTTWRPELHVWSNLCCGNRRNFTGMSDVTIRWVKAGVSVARHGMQQVLLASTGHGKKATGSL